MKPAFLIANWKLYLSVRASVRLAQALAKHYRKKKTRRLRFVLCPSTPALSLVGNETKTSPFQLGAQNVDLAVHGRATGEISIQDLSLLGCRYVLVGHSERRALGEDDELTRKKLHHVHQHGLTPILCVGESRWHRLRGQATTFVQHQLRRALTGWKRGALLIAYEPLWAIHDERGAHPCHPEDAKAMARAIHTFLFRRSASFARTTSILYGGSVSGSDIRHFVDGKNIQGVLVGAASTRFNEYVRMVKSLAS